MTLDITARSSTTNQLAFFKPLHSLGRSPSLAFEGQDFYELRSYEFGIASLCLLKLSILIAIVEESPLFLYLLLASALILVPHMVYSLEAFRVDIHWPGCPHNLSRLDPVIG